MAVAMLPESQRRGTEATSSAPLQSIPAVFGRFLLLKRLSRGGMGEIFLAKIGEIEGFEKPIIIKKILPNLVENQDFIARFVDEAQVAIKLNHANIAQVYEVGRVDGEYFLAIEYVEGRDLRRLMHRFREQRIRLPIDLCLYMARELVSGLAYAHRRTDSKGTPLALVHCDISPPNVMVSFEGEVKIIDFGIARSVLRTAGSNPNMGFGKFGYMAPEQLIRGGDIDRRTDIYAAGVVLYELLTGERLYPFPEGADYRQIARTVCQGQFLPPSQRDSGLDPLLDAIVGRALATQKEDRYQNAEEFRDALQQKLYQLSPTISADSLAHVMNELFTEERERERAELLEMRAVDVGAFQDELAGSATHTVTFARASMGKRLSGLLQVVSPISSPRDREEAPTSGVTALPASIDASRPTPRPLRGAVVGLIVAALAGGGGLTLLLRDRGKDASALSIGGPVQKNDQQKLHEGQPAVPVPVAEPLVIEPVRTPVPKPRHVTPRLNTPAAVKARTPARQQEVTPAVPEVKPGISPQAVEAKFKQIGNEYTDFKRKFGSRLEEKWQQILQEAAMGRKDQHLEDLLNQLRKEMNKARGAD